MQNKQKQIPDALHPGLNTPIQTHTKNPRNKETKKFNVSTQPESNSRPPAHCSPAQPIELKQTIYEFINSQTLLPTNRTASCLVCSLWSSRTSWIFEFHHVRTTTMRTDWRYDFMTPFRFQNKWCAFFAICLTTHPQKLRQPSKAPFSTTVWARVAPILIFCQF